METSKLICELIPPNDYNHRNGFTNEHLISKIPTEQLAEVESKLLEMLESSNDSLIGETLAAMNSTKSVELLKRKIDLSNTPFNKITWASFIVMINGHDEHLNNLALKEFEKIDPSLETLELFYILRRFNDERITERIRSFVNDDDYLVAYNSRRVLGISTTDLIQRERRRRKLMEDDKPWWKFW